MKSRRSLVRSLLGLGFLIGLALPAPAQKLVGGPCRYVDYPGRATIVAVTPDRGQSASGRLDVTFTFTPAGPIAGDPLYVPGQVRHLTLVGGSAPGPRFVAHYGLRPGLTLPCQLRTIRKGTCTPVLFDFPGLDLRHDPD